MKKFTFLITIIICCLFISNVNALTEVDKVSIDVSIGEDGYASISETWELKKSSKEFIRKLDYLNGASINDVDITSGDVAFKDDNSGKKNTYVFNKKSINIYTDLKQINIKYKAKGMVVKFKDVLGLSWTFIDGSKDVYIKQAVIDIFSSTKFDPENSGIKVVGSNLNASFVDGHMLINSHKLGNSKLRVLCSFSDDLFTEYIKSDLKYKEALNDKNLVFIVLGFVKKYFFIFLLVIVLIVLVLRFAYRNKRKKYKEFNNVKGNIHLSDNDEIPYLDNVPYDNLHRLSFIASYFNIQKNRSDLIGTFLLKWIFDDLITIREEDKFELVIQENVYPNDLLERELFEIIKDIATNRILDENKLRRYASSKGERIIAWYKSSVESVLNEEVKNGTLKVKQNKKKASYTITDKMLKEVNYIQGLKKYLLNFNQVPRKSELNIDNYKMLLLASELLGIGKLFAEEVLRKSSDNELALTLKKFEYNRTLFRSVYDLSLESMKPKKKKKVEEDE